MKFLISRASGEKKEIEGSFLELTPVWEERTVSEDRYNKRFSYHEGLWRSVGFNHSINAIGNIVRQMGQHKERVVIIDSIDELEKLSLKYGELIINYKTSPMMPTIEIYDDYRE